MLRRRRVLVFVVALFFAVLFGVVEMLRYIVDRHPELKRIELVQMVIGGKPLPPLYHNFRRAERRRLPQHNSRPFASGEKYLWVASHSCCRFSAHFTPI